MPTWAKWGISLLVAVGLIWLGWRYVPLLVTLHVMVCFVLIIVIMLQSGNAADLAGAFGGAGSQTAFGPRGAATFLSRATTWCAIVFMLTSLTLSVKRTPTDVGHRVASRTDVEGRDGLRNRRLRVRRKRPYKFQYSRGKLHRHQGRLRHSRRRLLRNNGFCYRFGSLRTRSWRNWQTHQLEGLAVAIPWWFESTRPHQPFRRGKVVPSERSEPRDFCSGIPQRCAATCCPSAITLPMCANPGRFK